MSDKNERTQNSAPENKKRINPGDIEGKLDVPDNRERRDGPGGD